MSRTADILRGQDRQWRGEAADAFRERVEVNAPEQLVRAEKSFAAAGSALTGWADLLVVHQRRADTLEARATELVQRSAVLQDQTNGMARTLHQLAPFGLISAPSTMSAWTTPDPAAARAEQLSGDLAVARARLSQAETDLGHVRGSAEQLRASTVEAAVGTTRGLVAAQELAPGGPGLLGQAAGAVGDAVSAGWEWYVEPYRELAADTMGWLEEHHELLRTISEITGRLSSVLSVLALVPLFAPLAAPAAVALGGVSALTAYGAAVGEKGDWTEGFTPGVVLGAATTLCVRLS